MSGDDTAKLHAPPTPVDDPGAHELSTKYVHLVEAAADDLVDEAYDSEDHFSDARSGPSALASPIPTTRVERVDKKPSHGEVSGTAAHAIRSADAKPDEVAVVPEDGTGASKKSSAGGRPRSATTPGDLPIPSTKVQKVDDVPSHGEVPGTDAYEMREGDAKPDEVEIVGDAPGSPNSNTSRSSSLRQRQTRRPSAPGAKAFGSPPDHHETEDGADDEGFGDDFDDFEAGEENAEFDDFEEGFQEAPASVPTQPSLSKNDLVLPILDIDELDTKEAVAAAIGPYLDAIFPPDAVDTSAIPEPSERSPIFFTDRSTSLWSQLVAPPPLQPPNWIRSRIRRLFLVSLGVPVDLDEILPASKQKKLILPSTHLHRNLTSPSSPRTSSDARPLHRLQHDGTNISTTSLDSQGRDGGRSSSSKQSRRKGPPPAPELDLVSARQLCSMTDEALHGLTTAELQEHVSRLKDLQVRATQVLDYWTKCTDERLGDREAFEGVIENLVKHARKVRK